MSHLRFDASPQRIASIGGRPLGLSKKACTRPVNANQRTPPSLLTAAGWNAFFGFAFAFWYTAQRSKPTCVPEQRVRNRVRACVCVLLSVFMF